MNARGLVVVLLLVLVVSEPASAHTPIQGIGNFYNGLLHPVLVPAHVLLLLAFGLFLGQQGPKKTQPAFAVFAFATIAGLVAAWFSIGGETEVLVLGLSAVVGLLVAISPQVALVWCGALALLAGFFLGIDSAQSELVGKAKLASLFGSGVAIYLLVLYPIALADHFNSKVWQRIGIRVVGSWVAASSLLVLALTLSAKP
ncbi:MAG: HupE/UreJ family protein [Gammaproteobacteria bacterium]|nr:HupE/UreJ family protein [Gammaproteobacteria bacterium]